MPLIEVIKFATSHNILLDHLLIIMIQQFSVIVGKFNEKL